MIYNKKHENGEIVAIKLITGDELIAKLVECDMDNIRLSKPMMLVHTPKGLAMSQFMMMQDIEDVIAIQTDKVIAITKANSVASGQYSQTVSSIKVPTPQEKSSIITS
jgi:hypothetical protein